MKESAIKARQKMLQMRMTVRKGTKSCSAAKPRRNRTGMMKTFHFIFVLTQLCHSLAVKKARSFWPRMTRITRMNAEKKKFERTTPSSKGCHPSFVRRGVFSHESREKTRIKGELFELRVLGFHALKSVAI